jgi:hypothetical protein
MNGLILLEQPNELGSMKCRKTRRRRPMPPPEARDWLTANEAALQLGCSVATVHRLRRGLISRNRAAAFLSVWTESSSSARHRLPGGGNER